VLRDLRPDVPEPVATLIDGLVAHDASTREGMHAREVAVALNAIASRLARRPAAQPATITRIVEAGERPSSPQTPAPLRTTGEATMQSVDTPERHFKEAMDALERSIRMLERSVERAAIEVREAAQTDDTKRIERVVAGHEQAQADLESALARWEQILAGAIPSH
jgi:exonuclease VII small subunit